MLQEEFKLLIGEALGFNRRGDSLGGAALSGGLYCKYIVSFNRRGDSLGGAANSK